MRADPKTEAEVRKATEAIFEAYSRKDADALLSMMIPGDDAFTFGPGDGDRCQGVEEHRASLEWDFSVAQGPRYELQWLKVWSHGDVAWVAGEWIFTARLPDGEVQNCGRGTAVFIRRQGRWLLAQNHFSLGAPDLNIDEFPGADHD